MLHLVEVIAVLDELTPTSPVTLASVHVTAVLARTANPAADPSPPEAWAGTADTPPSVAKKRRPRTRTLKSVRPTAFIPPAPLGPFRPPAAMPLRKSSRCGQPSINVHNKVSKSLNGPRVADAPAVWPACDRPTPALDAGAAQLAGEPSRGEPSRRRVAKLGPQGDWGPSRESARRAGR